MADGHYAMLGHPPPEGAVFRKTAEDYDSLVDNAGEMASAGSPPRPHQPPPSLGHTSRTN